MSLFDDAKLIITPNGYKAGKLHSLKPFDGSGDCTVVRNTTATRVNSAGLIESSAVNVPRLDYSGGATCPAILVEPQRTNLLLHSEEFDNAYWGKFRVTITPNDTASPNGLLTADKMTAGIDTLSYFIDRTLTGTGVFTASIFAKKGTVSWLYIRQGNGGGGTTLARAWFDLANGVVGGSDPNPISYKMEDYGNGWYKCSMTFEVLSGGAPRVQFYLTPADLVAIFSSDGTENIFLWGAELKQGATPSSYIPTTTATVTRNADVITATVPAGVTEITEYFEDNTTNVITTIPVTYTMSVGRISKVVMI